MLGLRSWSSRASGRPRRALAALSSTAAAALIAASCSESRPAASPSTVAPASAGAPMNQAYAAGSDKSAAVPAPEADVSSSRRPATLREAQASFAEAENKVITLVGTSSRPVPLDSDSCGTACKALASMRRATEHLCELSGDDPSQCDDARARLDRAAARVREVCGDCPDTDG